MSAHIIILLDQSGSMNLLDDQPLKAVNNILNTKFNNSDCYFSLYKFNDYVTPEFNFTQIPQWFEYQPIGRTALFDALGDAIDTNSLIDMTTVCIVITDGCDNASKHYKLPEIKQKIQILEDNNWSFVFMVSEQEYKDINYTANMFGLPANRFLSFNTNTQQELLNVTQKITDEISTQDAFNLFKNFNI